MALVAFLLLGVLASGALVRGDQRNDSNGSLPLLRLAVSSHHNDLAERYGSHMESILLNCNSSALSWIKYSIGDADQPVDIKIVSIAITSVVVGCPDTAMFLTSLLFDDGRNGTWSKSAVTEGPLENISNPCERSNAEKLKAALIGDKRYDTFYKLASPALFLSLGCESLGLEEYGRLSADFHLNNTTVTKRPRTIAQEERRKYTRIINYLNSQRNRLFRAIELTVTRDITKIQDTNHKRNKRSLVKKDIRKFFIVKRKCSIFRPMGVFFSPISKYDCLQQCLDSDGCKSIGYVNDNSQTCHMNTEDRQDVGQFFSCGKPNDLAWDYFEKKKSIDYFSISSKMNAMVLEVEWDSSVRMKPYTGKDNQLWYWDGDAIHSKQYQNKFLRFNINEYKRNGWSRVYVSSRPTFWNFEHNHLTTQHNNLNLDLKHGNRNEDAHVGVSAQTVNINQKWSLSLGRVYFIVTSRHSGKVLDASLIDSAQGVVHLWAYHGKDNQLWFWDEENIRCKKFPEKVLDFHMRDYKSSQWGKVYLYNYHGGDNQRWFAQNDNIVSYYNNVYLDVKDRKTSDGSLVGGCKQTGGVNQLWTFSFSRPYFFILNRESGKVMDAVSQTEIELWHYSYKDSQLWFWDGETIRNKKYADKVIDLHMRDYQNNQWGKIYLHTLHHGSNQKWRVEDNYLTTEYNQLTVEVKHRSQSDGSSIGASNGKHQKWNLQPEHDFFTLSSRMNAKVLDAASEYKVVMWSFHGLDHQLWFMDEKCIRSKRFPNKVLDLHIANYKAKGWGDVYLNTFHGGQNQRWKIDGDNIISEFQDLRLGIKDSDNEDWALVGGFPYNGNNNQKWNVDAKERFFFIIKSLLNERVVDATSKTDIDLWTYHGRDNQLWFWDGFCIRSKRYPDKVLDLHMFDYEKSGRGKIYLHSYHGGQNQLWSVDGKSIISNFEQLRMSVNERRKQPRIVGLRFTGNGYQKWALSLHQTSGSSCIDATEADIYNVVQYIPLIGTAWDLYSSIGYAIAGCNSVAQERAISYGIGAATDVATAFTGGAAAGVSAVAKTGIKVGIKVGIKQGMKAAVIVSKQSIKNAIKTAARNGIKSSLKRGFVKGGKLVIRETFVDPALFLKNSGKLSKQILLHPKRTLKSTWKAARRNVDDLKRLKKRLKDDPSYPKQRCKRGGILCKPKTELYATENQINMFKSIKDSKALSERIDRSAHRFMAKEVKEFDEKFSKAPSRLRRRYNSLDCERSKAELWAVYRYSEESGSVNYYIGSVLSNKPLHRALPKSSITDKDIKFAFENVAEVLDQADLIQSYLKKNQMNKETIVYRWEDEYETYVDNEIFETYTFKSTTTRTTAFKDTGVDLTKRKVEIKYHLKKSGASIRDLSKYPNQEEVLIPLGTKFHTKIETPTAESKLKRITMTEVD